MKRRYLLQYGALTAASLTFAACSKVVKQAKPVAFGKPENPEIKIGFVPSIDCLPLIVAKDRGFFQEQGIQANLVKFPTWDALQEALSKGKVDVAQMHFAMPLWSHLKKDKTLLVALMGMTLNGNSIGLSQQAWEEGLRPSPKFNYPREFGEAYNTYVRSFKQPPIFAIEHQAAMSNYLARYWLGSIQIDPERNFKFQVVKDKELLAGLKSGKIASYAIAESTNRQLIQDKQGFTAYVDRDIWQGHPDKILATTADWTKKNPIGAKAVIAAVLAACQFCDIERFRIEEDKKPIELAQELVKPEYLADGDTKAIKTLLTGNYQYDRLDTKSTTTHIPDFNVFHFVDGLDYLQEPNNANTIWHSQAVWVLTQMVRWNQLNLFEYPQNADDLIKAAYPLDTFQAVAKAVGLNLPKELTKKEPASVFIDKLAFDPSQAVNYINNFDLRAHRPQVFGLA
jgi:nitrate/nitrite transport system substrate-binding protein